MGWLNDVLRKLPVANRVARSHDTLLSEIRSLRFRQDQLENEVGELQWELAHQRGRTELLRGRIERFLSVALPGAPTSHCRIVLPDGRRLSVLVPVPPPDPISQSLARHCWPGIMPDCLQDRYLRPGKVLLDLGAHLGAWTLLAAARGCTVVAVEAHPDNVNLLRASVAANNFTTVHVISAAVSDRAGKLCLRWSGPYGYVVPLDQGRDGVEVPARTVDDILAGLGIGHVDLIKMDVEGSEVQALCGMAGLLAGPSAPAVFYESNGHCLYKFGHTTSDLRRHMADYGYSNFRLLTPTGFRPVAPEEVQAEVCVDYFATKVPPADWPGWDIAAPLTPGEFCQEIVNHCNSQSGPQREHLDRELLRAPAWLLQDERIRAARRGVESSADRPAA
jgi:FkbM family methyltransferase